MSELSVELLFLTSYVIVLLIKTHFELRNQA